MVTLSCVGESGRGTHARFRSQPHLVLDVLGQLVVCVNGEVHGQGLGPELLGHGWERW